MNGSTLKVYPGWPHGMCTTNKNQINEDRFAFIKHRDFKKKETAMANAPIIPMNEEKLEGVGGVKIFVRSWRPSGTPRGIMILIHGFNAHGGYMEWQGEQFAADGFAVYALDLRGRGKSEGERFYVEKFSDYLEDVDRLIRIAKSRNSGLPVYVLGHSAGGVIAASYVFEHQNEIDGLICVSFALDVGLPDAVSLVLKGVSHLTPHLHVFTLKNADFSRDPKAVERMNNDPLIAHESQPAETAAEFLKAAERLRENMPKFVRRFSLSMARPTRSQDLQAANISMTRPLRRTKH
jgi:alpha-beta hydrolase superfamily lysophospholipase